MKYVTLDITNKCNLNCKHCYNKLKYSENSNYRQLSNKEIINLINILHKNNCEGINFLGGEPLIREDMVEIIEYCSKLNIYTSLTTNGILLNNKLYNELLHSGIGKIDVSLDGLKNDNDFLRGKGTFDKVCNNLKAIKNCNHPKKVIRISYTITKTNVYNLFEFIKYMYDLDINKFIIGTFLDVNQTDSDSMKINKKQLSFYSEIEKVIKNISIYYGKKIEIELNLRPMYIYFMKNMYDVNLTNNLLYSKCAYKSGLKYIESNGRIHPCNVYILNEKTNFDLDTYNSYNVNIFDRNLDFKISKFLNFFDNMFVSANKKRYAFSFCESCELKSICEPCPFQFKDRLDYSDCEYVKYRIENILKSSNFNKIRNSAVTIGTFLKLKRENLI